MAYIFRRGASIPFAQTYYDSTGGIVQPSSVRCWVTYLSTSVDGDGSEPLEMARETTNFLLTYSTASNAFEGTWASTAAQPGWVYFHIKPADSTLDSVDGSFELRGNPANMASS